MNRQFLYIDHPLVRDFLSEREGGLLDETRELTSSDGQRGVEGRAAVGPVSGGAQRSKGTHAESEAVIRQTASAEFDRLYGHLDRDGLRILDAVDVPLEDIGLQRKEIVEVDARLRVSGIHALLDLMRMFTQAAPVFQQLGSSEQFDPEVLEGIRGVTALADNATALSLIGTVAGAAGASVALELQADGIRASAWDTEATILMKVQRLLRPGQSELVGDPFGGLMRVLPEEQRKELLSGLQADEMAKFGIGESEIKYPAIVGTPIAIYR